MRLGSVVVGVAFSMACICTVEIAGQLNETVLRGLETAEATEVFDWVEPIAATTETSFNPDLVAQCPRGSWPRNPYAGPGGGLYTGPGGGLYAGPGGGAYRGPGGGLYAGPGGGLYRGPGGGLYAGPGGGLYAGPGGGLYAGPTPYCGVMPPWNVFVKYLEENGYRDEARTIRRAFRDAGGHMTPDGLEKLLNKH